MTASLLFNSECIIGEGAFWHKERNSYFWVDIESRLLYEYNCQRREVKSWRMPFRVSLILQDETGDIFLCLQGGLAKINLNNGSLQWLLDIEKNISGNRTNDGGCDKEGRLWVGTMDLNGAKGAGSLYAISKGGQLNKKLNNLSIPNGLVWSPDNKYMYHVDSSSHIIKSYFFNADSSEITFAKIIIQIPENMGVPDGMAIDVEGMLWIAHWGGSCISRWDPFTGRLINTVPLPAPNVSSCAFVGEQLDQLLVTTARQNLSQEDLMKYPMSGHVFIINDPGVRGVKLNRMKI